METRKTAVEPLRALEWTEGYFDSRPLCHGSTREASVVGAADCKRQHADDSKPDKLRECYEGKPPPASKLPSLIKAPIHVPSITSVESCITAPIPMRFGSLNQKALERSTWRYAIENPIKPTTQTIHAPMYQVVDVRFLMQLQRLTAPPARQAEHTAS